ncbi:MAG: sodium:alanine symporter family protein [Gammaproteobacteria bacterium]|jgi:AGCS family alanine or glycine:cation symporter
MQTIHALLSQTSDFLWGKLLLILLLGCGVYLTIGLRAMPWRRIRIGFLLLWRGRHAKGEGDITPFQALMTALSATVGTGNIAGVATAIFIGGPGAVFWMWITALFGMATKYSEALLAVKYRETDEIGNHVGGPMYYIKNGMGHRWRWLGFLFALFGALAAFGIGNTVQANSVADAVNSTFHVPHMVTGLVIAAIAAMVILGGIRRIAQVADKLVPFMALVYVAGALIIILANLQAVPEAIRLILSDAFTGTAAGGGFAGATVMVAIRMGVARGIFSNEAGLGSAPIAHAAASTDDPIRQGTIGMLGTFIDTIVICTMTALVIVITGAWTGGENGAALSATAFNQGLPGFGEFIVSIGLILFAFTTLLGWSYYGERCAEYLLGVRVILPYRILWILAIPVGAVLKLNFVWLLADVLNALMALPNLIALLALSPVVFRMTREGLRHP